MINTKLERPLDSHAPQTEQLYLYDNDDWGEAYEDESDNQWQEQDSSDQYYETHEGYTAEEAHEEEPAAEEQDQEESDNSTKMIKIITCDIRIMYVPWMHTYLRPK